MGVIYKLREEVVQFIVSQRQGDPLLSCRQLAESASQKFGLNLSKSSVHDVLKEAGIITPRGRKPKDKFEIPQERKKQIQVSLSQVKLIPPPAIISPIEPKINLIADVAETAATPGIEMVEDLSPEHEGAGRIFLKATQWDLGIFADENIKAMDWAYYLTYSKGIRVGLENDKNFFIDLPLPIERCIREAADGIINNLRPLIVQKVSDEEIFKACMDAQVGFKIKNVSIVDEKDHILLELTDIVEFKRSFIVENRIFVDSKETNFMERSKQLFLSQSIDNNVLIENILNLKGFETKNKYENVVTLLIHDSYDNKIALQEAAERLNGMYLRDEQDRLVKVKIQSPAL